MQDTGTRISPFVKVYQEIYNAFSKNSSSFSAISREIRNQATCDQVPSRFLIFCDQVLQTLLKINPLGFEKPFIILRTLIIRNTIQCTASYHTFTQQNSVNVKVFPVNYLMLCYGYRHVLNHNSALQCHL
ncbi:hypothetical protein T10_2427 [Trichinella papuae]|uniref:Uncharacterized protein n=1 Tax=Trichinella papuae TaxID=268474 RepID=A0A0V1M0T7_9BILA|nr:hypothetical protein T10_2427 [Trichinella papuae]